MLATTSYVNTVNQPSASNYYNLQFCRGGFAAWMLIASATVMLSGCASPWTASTANLTLPAVASVPTAPDRAQSSSPPKSVEVPKSNALETSEQDSPSEEPIIRGQDPVGGAFGSLEEELQRESMPVSGLGEPTSSHVDPHVQPAQYELPPPGGVYGSGPPNFSSGAPTFGAAPGNGIAPYGVTGSAPAPGGIAPPGTAPGYGAPGYASPSYAPYDGSGIAAPYPVGPNPYAGDLGQPPGEYADLVVNLRETQTGRFMFGVGVNSDLGLTAQVIIDERNFDWRRWPRSLDDVFNGTAWRGGGQTLRIEAVPGSEVQRYLINFVEPYLWDTPISFNVSGYLFDRRYFDWDEQRLGGRIGFGYRITPDLSINLGLRAENVDLSNVRVRGIDEIESVLGDSDLFSGKLTLTHDTRDIPFAPTQGHYLELSYEQAFGSFDFPRGVVDYRRYFLLRERADGSGRHTLGFSFKGGLSGSQTPVFENFFAGGYSTLRGFRFRHASPKIQDVIVGGELSLLGSAEYIFPITADDMLKGALFTDFGTVEREIDIDSDNFRVTVGAGLRISVPAMGPAPIAVDFGVPITRADTDRIQNFSFFVGFGR